MGRLPVDPVAEAHRQWTEHGWGSAADGMAAVTSVMRAQQILLARTEQVLRPLGLTFARYEVLMLLHFSRAGALPMRVLGSRLQVHPTSVTNAVSRLEAAGLVRRTPHPTDRRALLVELQPEGQTLAEHATALLNAQVFAPESGRGGQLVAALRGLREDAGDIEPGASTGRS